VLKLVRFKAQQYTSSGWRKYQISLNPEDVSHIRDSDIKGWTFVSMRNKSTAYVEGTIEEVEQKLMEV
jgi:hypothetical protein